MSCSANTILDRLEIPTGLDPNILVRFMSRGGDEFVCCTVALARELSELQGEPLVSDQLTLLKHFTRLHESYLEMKEAFGQINVNVQPPQPDDGSGIPFLSFFGFGSDFRSVSEEEKLALSVRDIHNHLLYAPFKETGVSREDCGSHWGPL